MSQGLKKKDRRTTSRTEMGKLPTLKEFEAMRFVGKGFTRELLASWGVSWPPKKGWAKKFAKKLQRNGDRYVPDAHSPFPPVRSRAEKDEFYASWDWKRLRMETLERDGRVCVSCGATPGHGVRLVVDHIKPLGEFWELRLEPKNTQVLCNDCNMGKGNWLHKSFKEAESTADHSPAQEDRDELNDEFRAIMREDER